MQQPFRRLGKINCLEINHGDELPWVILFHGYGADANDLYSIGEIIKTQRQYNWLFPQGPLEVPIGPGWTGRAWWPIDMQAIMQAQMMGTTRDMSDTSPLGIEKLRVSVDEMVKQMRVAHSQIIVGGFSQGAMLATDLFLRTPDSFAGLALLSGTLILQEEWKKLAPSKAGAQFFQSHGQNDLVLGYKQAQKLETLLTQAGLKGSLKGFSGGHEIPHKVVMDLAKYIDQQFA